MFAGFFKAFTGVGLISSGLNSYNHRFNPSKVLCSDLLFSLPAVKFVKLVYSCPLEASSQYFLLPSSKKE